ncbi:hypothetical protein KBD69_03655 [Candidatus Woesebacteria bacterium]|nr:hypothetical protein [Candidatus Woesebacteria bacterium]
MNIIDRRTLFRDEPGHIGRFTMTTEEVKEIQRLDGETAGSISDSIKVFCHEFDLSRENQQVIANPEYVPDIVSIFTALKFKEDKA